MTVLQETICPGCGLRMPARKTTTTSRGYYNVSDECWDVYTEVLGTEYSDAVLFGQGAYHRMTNWVDHKWTFGILFKSKIRVK